MSSLLFLARFDVSAREARLATRTLNILAYNNASWQLVVIDLTSWSKKLLRVAIVSEVVRILDSK